MKFLKIIIMVSILLFLFECDSMFYTVNKSSGTYFTDVTSDPPGAKVFSRFPAAPLFSWDSTIPYYLMGVTPCGWAHHPSFDYDEVQVEWPDGTKSAWERQNANSSSTYKFHFVKEKGNEQILTNETQKKLTTIIKNKKIAIVNIAINTQGISNDLTSTVIDFLVNSFVNTGIVIVVDRKNISDIIKEHDFQLSDLVDEKTVVQIGKLVGADIIVTGSISLISSEYYLNIQLKSVITGEIIGSAISTTRNKTNFLEMCNEAVRKLF